VYGTVELFEDDAAEGRVLNHVVFQEYVIELGLHRRARTRDDLEDDAARSLRSVPTCLEGHAGGVVGGASTDPIHHARHVMDETASNVEMLERAAVHAAHGNAAHVPEAGFPVRDFEIVELPVLLVDE
jgi:hypothetical protein